MERKKFKFCQVTIVGTERKRLRSKFLVLVSVIFVTTVAGLIAGAGTGLCLQNSIEKSLEEGVFGIANWCDDLDVIVFSHDYQDIKIVCEGARDAIMFLESHGLDVTDTIVIELLTELPVSVDSSVAGYYLESERRVLILVYSEFKKFETWFGVPVDRSLYRSAISHEVAHMVADLNFAIKKPTIQAKEYIAYVIQFSTMEPVLREKVLSNFQGEAFEGDWQMSSTIYMLDPMGFGLRSYLHFLKLTDGDQYLHAILNGEALFFDFW